MREKHQRTKRKEHRKIRLHHRHLSDYHHDGEHRDRRQQIRRLRALPLPPDDIFLNEKYIAATDAKIPKRTDGVFTRPTNPAKSIIHQNTSQKGTASILIREVAHILHSRNQQAVQLVFLIHKHSARIKSAKSKPATNQTIVAFDAASHEKFPTAKAKP